MKEGSDTAPSVSLTIISAPHTPGKPLGAGLSLTSSKEHITMLLSKAAEG